MPFVIYQCVGISYLFQPMQDEIVILAAKRTPFGSFGGSLKNFTANDLAVEASKACLSQAKVDPKDVDHVTYGNVLQTSKDAIYLARHVALRSGLKEDTAAVTINRLCGSSFETILDARRRILLGEATTVLSGGSESMSQSPFVSRNARWGQKLGHIELEDSLMTGLTDQYVNLPMAITAENLAEKYSISRKECDEYALSSHQRATKAYDEGSFANEIAPFEYEVRGKKESLKTDEHLRREATIESLTKLKPVFKKDGVVTAGNASGMVDGACSILVTSKKNASNKGYTALATLVDGYVIGCDPKIMGLGPVPAIQKLLHKNNLKMDDIHLFEVNEAFAPQCLAVQKELKIPSDKFNLDGGAISLGHPLAASGARIMAHLVYRLQKRGGGLAIGSACIGGGQGIAVLIKI